MPDRTAKMAESWHTRHTEAVMRGVCQAQDAPRGQDAEACGGSTLVGEKKKSSTQSATPQCTSQVKQLCCFVSL